VEVIESSAVNGQGVRETFDAVTKLLVQEANRRQKMYEQGQVSASRALNTKVGLARMGVKPAKAGDAEATPGKQNLGAALWDDLKPSAPEAAVSPKPPPPPSFTASPDGIPELVDQLTRLIEERRKTEDEILSVLQDIRDRLA